MITLKEACSIAKRELNSPETAVHSICTDLGDCWVFDWIFKPNPERAIPDKPYLVIDRKSGKLEFRSIGVPRQDFFDRMTDRKANRINLSEYL